MTIPRLFWVAAAIVGLVLMAGAYALQPGMNTLAGITAHTICTEHFVSGLSPARIYDESLRPIPAIAALHPVTAIDVEAQGQSVRVSVLGVFTRTAFFSSGAGCTLFKRMPPLTKPDNGANVSVIGWDPSYASANPIGAANPALAQALDRAFGENAGALKRNTRAVLVVQDGRIVAERYTTGFGVDTPLLGYSLTKSVNNALIGLLANQHRIDVHASLPIAEWHDDPRGAITIEELMRMTSGLGLTETHTGWDPVSQMLYSSPDMANYARQVALTEVPGRKFDYSSGNTLLVAGAARDLIGGGPQGVVKFLQRELFEPLGMRSAVFETDTTGTPIGSTYFMASARDWSKIGQLYLNGGALQGQRFFPKDWIKYSTTRTLDSAYGAGFWLSPAGQTSASSRLPDAGNLPEDGYLGRGYLGQYLIVVPSRRLLILRFGASLDPSDDGSGAAINGVSRLISDVLSAIPQ